MSQPSSQPFAPRRAQKVSHAGMGTSSSKLSNERAAPPYGSHRSGHTCSDGLHDPLSHVVSRMTEPSVHAHTAIGQPCPLAHALGSGASNTVVPPHAESAPATKIAMAAMPERRRLEVTRISYGQTGRGANPDGAELLPTELR